jgi:soluble lytic murein transglycosylase-like protein
MPRARTKKYTQTAAAPEDASGCFGFLLPPFAVLMVSAILAFFALNNPRQIQAAELPPVSSSSISPIFTPEIQYWSGAISRWAAASSVDPDLAAVVMQIESCGDPRARSSAGAMGLFQVMPFHFSALDNPYDPETNAARGLAYLAKSLATAGGNVRLALAGYNGGIGVISRAEWTWSAQTKRYVHYGWPIYSDAKNGATTNAVLDEWYGKYGAGLCRQARQRLGLP